jgi:hypothetical protein
MKQIVASILTFILNALLFCVSFVLYHFEPVRDRVKGIMNHVSGQVSKIVYSAKAWMYAERARLRVYMWDSPLSIQ